VQSPLDRRSDLAPHRREPLRNEDLTRFGNPWKSGRNRSDPDGFGDSGADIEVAERLC